MTDEGLPTTRTGWRRGDSALVTAGVVACAVCCAGPLIGLLASIGLTSAVLAVAVPAFAVVAVSAAMGVWWLRRRSRARCEPTGVADLSMPTVRTGSADPHIPAAPSNITPQGPAPAGQ